MKITGTLVNAYFVCKRKVWLFAHELSPDPDLELLEIGRLISEETYKREKKEITLEGMKIDIVRSSNGNILVGEIKKSSKELKSSIMQLVFYLYNLKKQGLDFKGEILIPKEKKKIKIELTPELEDELKKCLKEIKNLTSQ
ncbi:CRISPR-associated protein Cas4 [bacterium]|nr:CRISPR-associated protein Cas4 [bacterium]